MALIGRIKKVLGLKCSLKSGQNDALGYSEKRNFDVKKVLWLPITQLLENVGLLFIPSSGHTGCNHQFDLIYPNH